MAMPDAVRELVRGHNLAVEVVSSDRSDDPFRDDADDPPAAGGVAWIVHQPIGWSKGRLRERVTL